MAEQRRHGPQRRIAAASATLSLMRRLEHGLRWRLPVLAAHGVTSAMQAWRSSSKTLSGPKDTVLIATGRLDAAVVGFTAATFNAIDHGLGPATSADILGARWDG
jgi:hypothetical protein